MTEGTAGSGRGTPEVGERLTRWTDGPVLVRDEHGQVWLGVHPVEQGGGVMAHLSADGGAADDGGLVVVSEERGAVVLSAEDAAGPWVAFRLHHELADRIGEVLGQHPAG